MSRFLRVTVGWTLLFFALTDVAVAFAGSDARYLWLLPHKCFLIGAVFNAALGVYMLRRRRSWGRAA